MEMRSSRKDREDQPESVGIDTGIDVNRTPDGSSIPIFVADPAGEGGGGKDGAVITASAILTSANSGPDTASAGTVIDLPVNSPDIAWRRHV